MQNFNMTLAASGTLATGPKIKYIFTLVRGESLHHFDLLSTDGEGVNPLKVKTITLWLASHCFPFKQLS